MRLYFHTVVYGLIVLCCCHFHSFATVWFVFSCIFWYLVLVHIYYLTFEERARKTKEVLLIYSRIEFFIPYLFVLYLPRLASSLLFHCFVFCSLCLGRLLHISVFLGCILLKTKAANMDTVGLLFELHCDLVNVIKSFLCLWFRMGNS